MKKTKVILFLVFLFLISSLIHPTEKKVFDLSEILNLVLETNPLLSAKKSEVEARKASYHAAKHFANPELELNIGRAKSFDEDLEQNTGGLSLCQHVENPFKRHHRLQVYAKDMEAAKFSQDILIVLPLVFQTLKKIKK
ncbi:MAG: hypothetical protein JSV17_05905 [Candidatus Aminicenantes bacterium]|nr:MAG: hypothetical protein JSV17_05905 [Candidatus Aminicenantes bacterium]